MESVKALIKLRNNESSLRGLKYHFTNEYDDRRLIEYVRLDDEGNGIQILLNGSEHTIAVEGSDEDTLFRSGFKDNVLYPGGTLIRRRRG